MRSRADIAEAADVPLGNIYYYFKTKDDLVAAVVDADLERIEAMTGELDPRHRTPKARLKALVSGVADRRDTIARFGCPYGTLCSELVKRPGGAEASPPARRLMGTLIDWAQKQFAELG